MDRYPLNTTDFNAAAAASFQYRRSGSEIALIGTSLPVSQADKRIFFLPCDSSRPIPKSGKGFPFFLLDHGAANSGDPQRMFINLRPSNEHDVIFTWLTTPSLTD
jgi:hypothetical protein